MWQLLLWRARAKCTGLASSPLHTSNHDGGVNHGAVLDVKMICRWVVIPISCGPAETVNYERTQAGRQAGGSTPESTHSQSYMPRKYIFRFEGAENADSPPTDEGQGHCSGG